MYSDILFLLGGSDLEMQTIADLLKLHNIPFVDKKLKWNAAQLSVYQEELDKYGDKTKIYGIELTENKEVRIPSNYVRIDHHNDYSSKSSSLEQVLDILQIPTSRYFQLVAANDKGYIPAMKEIGATDEEIQKIRQADRFAQGITFEDEDIAKKEIKYVCGTSNNLLIVKTSLSHFSPITDRLYPYERLLIYNDKKLCFYGDGVKDLVGIYKSEIQENKIYHGGGDSGYFGTVEGSFSVDEFLEIVNLIKNKYSSASSPKSPYSYHIFYFPFRWDILEKENSLLSEQINLENINYTQSLWERTQYISNENEQKDLYNEKNYYHQFVHHILYDELNSKTNYIHHFERYEPKNSSHIHYIIKLKNREIPYSLQVKAMNINLYSTGVGFLSFYLSNEDINQSTPQDILNINQYGRRIMPPFFDDIQYRNEIAEYIAIEGLTSETIYREDFNLYTTQDSWKQASFITLLIGDLSDNIKITPIIDDRMYVASWYKNDELAQQFTSDENIYCNTDTSFSSFWYKYLFVDGSSETCQNNKMKQELLQKHTYLRWQKWSSLYGVSRYSFVYLTNSDVPDYLLNYFQTIYARMVELVILQRSSMLRFSSEVSKVSNFANQDVDIISQRVSSLYKEYIKFINQIYFREVTSQDQGIELYSMFHDNLNMTDYITDLDGEIEELHQYVSLKEDQSRNQKAAFLNNIATLLLPVTVITGFWGMNKWEDVVGDDLFINQCILILIGLIIAICIIYNRRKKL